MNQFSKNNSLCECRICGKKTHSSIDGDLDIQLCRKCYDLANLENEHSDRHQELVRGCTFCEEIENVYLSESSDDSSN